MEDSCNIVGEEMLSFVSPRICFEQIFAQGLHQVSIEWMTWRWSMTLHQTIFHEHRMRSVNCGAKYKNGWNYQRDHFTCTCVWRGNSSTSQERPQNSCKPTKSDTKLISKTESLLGHGPVPVSFNAHYFQLRSGVCLWLCTGTNPKLWTRTSVAWWHRWLLECRIIVRVHLNPLSLSLPALLQFLHIAVSCHCK